MKLLFLLPLRLAFAVLALVATLLLVLFWLPLAVVESLIYPERKL